MSESAFELDGSAAAKVFYRKSYTRAKGCITEVNEVADAVLQLCEACSRGADGEVDIEQVRRAL